MQIAHLYADVKHLPFVSYHLDGFILLSYLWEYQ